MLHGSIVNGELVLSIDGRRFVQSRSDRTVFYEATFAGCECAFAQHRPAVMCRHQKAVSEWNRLMYARAKGRTAA